MTRAPLLALLLAFASEAAIAQSASVEPGSRLQPPAPIPRTADGRPDLSGNWETAFITSTGRMDGATSLVASDAEAEQLSRTYVEWAHSEAAGAIVDPDFFVAGVTKLSRVKGEWRTSLITTGDGVQAYTDEGKRLDAERRALNAKQVDDPEMRPLFERCLVGVGSAPLTGVPSALSRQFVQTPDHVVISTDGNDVRIIGLGALPRPAAVISPLGDSTAHWEGDTLVVHTTGMSGQVHRQIITRPESRVIERFELLNANELFYQFTVEDTEIYEKPWSAEFVMTRTHHAVMEYACHEGNHSMFHMLLAGRTADRRAAQTGS